MRTTLRRNKPNTPQEPLSELPDDEIARRVTEAERRFARLDAEDPASVTREGRSETILRAMRDARTTIEAGKAELAARRQEAARANLPVARSYRQHQDERDALHAERQPARQALERVRRFGHPELQGVNLDPGRLTHEEGTELKSLVGRRLAVALGDEGAEALTDDETALYQSLIGKSAGDEHLFTSKRRALETKRLVKDLARARKRHPQAESLVAAVMSDPDLFDLLHERVRPNATLVDEYGRETRGTLTERVLDLEHLSTLYLLLHLIVENGGRPITVPSSGWIDRAPEAGHLPLLPVPALAQLRRNGFITSTRTDDGQRWIGLGSRVLTIATRWEIPLPEEARDKPCGDN